MIITLIFLLSLSASAFAANDSLTVKAKTESYGGRYAQKNCVIIWVQKPNNTFIKTIWKAAYRHADKCKKWDEVSGNKGLTASAKDFDGLTKATRDEFEEHKDTIFATWDLTGKDGKRVEDGEYQLWIEMTESHDTSMLNHLTFTIGGPCTTKAPSTQYIPVLEAYYNCTSVKKKITSDKNGINLISESNLISVSFPSFGSYSISLFSPAGRVISTTKGKGTSAILPINFFQKNGVYLLRISHSGKESTLRYVKGF